MSLAKRLRSLLIPNPFLGLVLASVLFLLAALFVFGQDGRFPNDNVAEILRTIAIGALAAAVTVVIDRQLTLHTFDERIRASLREASGVSSALSQLGVKTAHPNLDFRRIFQEARAGETIRWLDTYCPRQDEFFSDLIAALDRGVAVQMLTIDPDCDNAKHRDLELAGTVVDTGEGWAAGLGAFAAKMRAIAAAHDGRFEIRTYDDLPGTPMYLIGSDEGARLGFFSLYLTRASAHCAHLELDSGEWLAGMADYFDAKWRRHEPRSDAAAPRPTAD